MRIVFDTNVLIAALITTDGVCGALVKRCAQVHTPIASEFILDELHEKLIGKFRKRRSDVDDAVLGTAVAGMAECIITGDKDLLVLRQYEGIDIIPPSGFDDYEGRQA